MLFDLKYQATQDHDPNSEETNEESSLVVSLESFQALAQSLPPSLNVVMETEMGVQRGRRGQGSRGPGMKRKRLITESIADLQRMPFKFAAE